MYIKTIYFVLHQNLSTSTKIYKDIYWNDLSDPNEPNFNKVLIANRGEIACRIIKTCRRLGIQTVAIHSEADYLSRFVSMADESICVGLAPTAQSYLNMAAILDAVKQTGAEAVHPGYGFLSENTQFASELDKINVAFLGPNSNAIHLMGDKIESKRVAEKAQVNCIPGFDGEIRDQDHAVKIAKEIGYPVMIKASAGGGGKGMRIAWNEKETREGFELSKAEAKSSFGDDRMLIEKFIDDPRHIEIQVLCDRHGNGIYLNERECSIQRRNQKVVEEAPSTFLDESTRAAMGEQALSLAKAVQYDSAGTVEFLVDSNRNFYFLEMNTRLQVEHPITECITGLDIVHQMLRIGKGYRLLHKQSDIPVDGWAFECRVYAEDPYKSFGLPSIGRLHLYSEPLDLPNVRCDSGVQTGSNISIYYDSMICKLVTYGSSRAEALDWMTRALDHYVIRGVTHNISLLRDICSNERFKQGKTSTNYLKEVYPDGFKGRSFTSRESDNLISVGVSMYVKDALRNYAKSHGSWDLVATWSQSSGQRKYIRCLVTRTDCKQGFDVQLQPWSPPSHILADDTQDSVDDASRTNEDGSCIFVADNFKLSDQIVYHAFEDENMVIQLIDRTNYTFKLQYMGTVVPIDIVPTRSAWYRAKYMTPKQSADSNLLCIAPMPGLIRSIGVHVGDRVASGQELCVIEAMKMQNILCANQDGVVKHIKYKVNDAVSVGNILVELEG